MKFCPVCRLFLDTLEWHGLSLLTCSSCGGVWTPATALPELAGELRPTVDLLVSRPAVAAPSAFEGLGHACPECLTTNLAPCDDLDLGTRAHRCPKCGGTWLERKEPAEPVAPPAEMARPARPAESELAAQAEPTPAQPAEVAATSLETIAPPHALELPCSGPDEAWSRLLAGNERFATGSPAHVHADFERVAEVRTGQSPFVVIVSCSDSRVPPEIIFDRGIGDLFVVRTAGHVVTTTAAASVMYAIEHLGVTLVVVLGHSGCGAVEAALSDRHTGTYLEPVVRAIRPAVELSASEPGSHWDNAVRAHLRRTVAGLEEAAERRLPSGRGTACRFVGACYDLGTGRVEVVVDAGAPTRTGERDHVEHVGAVPAPPASGHEAVAAVPPEPPPEAATMVLEPGRQEELAAPDAQLTPPGDPSSSRYPHWCPKCRAGFEACTTFCNRCGLLLVQPWFKVPCLKCGKDNLIGEERCWGCRAEVHPAWLASGLRKPRPPLVDFGRPTGANQQTGCGTSVIGAVLLASALCTWALHMALS